MNTSRLVVGEGRLEFAGKTFVAGIAKVGTPLFVSGLTAVRIDGPFPSDLGVAAQAEVIFAQLGEILSEVDVGPDSVVKTTDYIISRSGYRDVAEVRRNFFGKDFPAATGIVVKELLGKGVLIEMDAVVIL